MALSIIPSGDTPISEFFTWREALYLPKWQRMANESDGVTENILINLKFLFKKMDVVRAFLDRPIIVHCAWRSVAYNALVEGAKNSAHLALEPLVAAVDFHVSGKSCYGVKNALVSHLPEWDMRMENNGKNASWIHMDTRPPVLTRYFLP